MQKLSYLGMFWFIGKENLVILPNIHSLTQRTLVEYQLFYLLSVLVDGC